MKIKFQTYYFIIFNIILSCNNGQEKIKIELIKKIKSNEIEADTNYLINDRFNNLKIYNFLISNEICNFNANKLVKCPDFFYLKINEDLYYPIIKLSFKNANEKEQLINCLKKNIKERREFSINFIVNEDCEIKIVGFPNRISSKKPIYLDSTYFRKRESFIEVYNLK